jgi:hypothetical protein
LQEIISKRKWDSKLFDTGRIDEKERPIYGTKIQNGLHDIEPDGSFVDVNTWFQPYAVGVSTDKVIRNRCGEVRVSDTASESKDLAKVKTKNLCGVSLKLKGYKTYGPHFDDLKSTYYTTDNGITLKYYPNYNGVNIVIVINNPQTAANVYRFSIQEYGCSYTYEKVEGGIKCISSTGKDDIYIKALYVKDANDDYGAVDIDLDGVENGRQIIKKTIAPVWLGNAVGPVESDPSVTIDDDSGTFEDANISSVPAQLDYNWGGQIFNQMYNGVLAFSNNALYYVDLSTYAGATITSAKYTFNCIARSGATFTVTVNPVLRQWGEGNKSGSSASVGECSGNSARDSEESWTGVICTGSGTDYNATAAATFTSPASTGSFDVTLTNASVQAKIDGTNYGDVFRVPLTNTGAYFRVDSSESVGTKPSFYMEYTEGDGEASHISLSIYDKQFNAFNELSGKNTIV